MKFFKKKAKFVGYVVYNDDKLREWRCPKCGMSIEEDYVCCPYCGQAVKFPTLPEDEINNFIKKRWRNLLLSMVWALLFWIQNQTLG